MKEKKLKKNYSIEHQLFTTNALQDIAKKIRNSIIPQKKNIKLDNHTFTPHGNNESDKQILKLKRLLNLPKKG